MKKIKKVQDLEEDPEHEMLIPFLLAQAGQ